MIPLRRSAFVVLALVAATPLSAQTAAPGACGQPSALTTRLAAQLPAGFPQLRLPLLLQRSEPAYVEFSLASPQEVSLYSESTTGDPVMALYDASGALLAWDDDSAGDLNALIVRSLDAGTYCTQLRAIGAAPVEAITFNLVVESGTFVPDLPPSGTIDCGGPGLAGYLAVGLTPQADPVGRAGRTNDATGESWYGLSVDAHATLRIDAASDEIDTVLEIFGEDGGTLHENDDYPGLGTDSRIEAAFAPGDYCVKVRGFAGAEGGYTLAVAPVEGSAQTDTTFGAVGAGPCGDPALTETLASGLTSSSAPTRINGATDPQIRAGWYSLSLAEQVEIMLQATSGELDTVLELYDGGGSLLVENDDYPGMGTDSRIDALLDPGDYCVLVRGFADSEGPFTLALSIAGGPAAAPDLPDPREAADIEDMGLLTDEVRSYAITSDEALFASFAVNEPGPVVVEGVSVSSAFLIALYDADAELVEATEMMPPFGAATLTLDLPVGVYLVGLVNDGVTGAPLLRQITVRRP